VDKYNKAYFGLIHLVLDKLHRPGRSEPTILTLEVKRLPGHPLYIRICSIMDEMREGHKHNKCSNCKQLGHYNVRCSYRPAPSSSIR